MFQTDTELNITYTAERRAVLRYVIYDVGSKMVTFKYINTNNTQKHKEMPVLKAVLHSSPTTNPPRTQTMKLHITQFSPVWCHVFSPRYKYSSRHPTHLFPLGKDTKIYPPQNHRLHWNTMYCTQMSSLFYISRRKTKDSETNWHSHNKSYFIWVFHLQPNQTLSIINMEAACPSETSVST